MGAQPARRTLIEATISSIHRHGLAATTVGTVTEIAGLSRGMVRHVFSSKAEMLAETFAVLVDEWTAATEPAPDAAPGEGLETTIRAMFAPDVFTDERVAAWLALSAAASATPELRSVRERAQRSWAEHLERSLAELGVDRPADRAIALLALADGLWLRQALEPAALPRDVAETIALDIARLVIRGGS